jgi:cation:H+ antiporter
MSAALTLALGAAVALGASAVLVAVLERLGARFGLSEATLGLVVALAADSPEVSSAVAAFVRGQQDVGVGVVLGSNVFNLAALLGLSAIVAGHIALHRRVLLFEGVVAVWMAALSVAVVAALLSPAVGLALALVVVTPYVALSALRPSDSGQLLLPARWRAWLAEAVAEEELELSVAIAPRKGTWKDAAVAPIALVAVVGASAAMEHAASVIGARHAVPSIVVGAVVLAGVTSLPNAVAAVYLARRGRGSATLSVALNSNTVNVVIGLLLPALLSSTATPSRGTALVAGWYAGLTLCTLALALKGRGLDRRAGGLIIGIYLVLVGTLLTA